MKRYNIPVDWDAMQPLIISVLNETLDDIRRDWEKVYTTKRGFVFSTDYEDDLEQLSAHITAFKKIIRYHGGSPT